MGVGFGGKEEPASTISEYPLIELVKMARRGRNWREEDVFEVSRSKDRGIKPFLVVKTIPLGETQLFPAIDDVQVVL